MLDSIDIVRSQGLSHYVNLPEIIVCGDQSSGKSFVLEAISGLSFPTKDNLCTRFAARSRQRSIQRSRTWAPLLRLSKEYMGITDGKKKNQGRQLVLDYMTRPRSIIIAVVSANNDFANEER